MEEELTTKMHWEFFKDTGEYTYEEFCCLGVYGRMAQGMSKEEALKEHAISEEIYDSTIEQALAKP